MEALRATLGMDSERLSPLHWEHSFGGNVANTERRAIDVMMSSPDGSSESPGDQLATIPVIMCVHHRPQFFADTLTALRDQTDQRFRLIVWDNTESRWDVGEALNGCPLDVTVLGGGENIGGIGRFHAARDFTGDSEVAIFLDDDQVFGSDLVQTFRKEARSDRIAGWWAWRFRGGGYFDRARVQVGGEADYVGTGGMVCPLAVFKDAGLFEAFPSRYSRVEDLWLCAYFKHRIGGKLVRSSVDIAFADGDKYPDQWVEIADLKREFFRFIREWRRTGLSDDE